jgi:uncharacterized membrane protein YccC
VPRLHRTLQTVREATALAPARPAYAAGLRAAIATVLPLVVAHVLGLGDAGTWMSLGGFNGALSDRGGPYRTRALTMGALAIATATAVLVGSLAGSHAGYAIPVTFLVALVASLARVWGNAGISIGSASLSTFVIALAFPASSPSEALVRAGYAIAGGLWAMAVALVLWPLQPYRPARLAVAECYRALGNYIDDVARGLREAGSDGRAILPAGSGVVRTALENARAVLARMRRGRPGAGGRDEQLLVLGEAADQLFGLVAAMTDTMMAIPRSSRDTAAQRMMIEALDALSAAARALADGVVEERDVPRIPPTMSGDALRALCAKLDGTTRSHDAVVHYQHGATILDRIAQFATVATVTVQALKDGRASTAAVPGSVADEPDDVVSPLAMLRAIITAESVILRYALRVAVVTSAAVALAGAFGIKRGYWLTITVIVILQPYTGATTHRALQRVIGTVLGGLLTAALGAWLHDPRAILVLSFIFAAACVALMPLNYAAYSVFLTPTFVLLAEADAGDWHLAGTRVVNTLLGGVLALAGSRLLWPSPEWSRFPGYMASMLRANRDYLRCVVSLFGDRSDRAGETIRESRRHIGLASVNAEESFQRLIGEYDGPGAELEALMTLLTYTRRFTASTAALALTRHSSDGEDPAPLHRFSVVATAVLDDLAEAILEDRQPAPLPFADDEEEAPTAGPLLQVRIDRLSRQLRMLHEGVERWTTRERNERDVATASRFSPLEIANQR